MGRRDDAGQSVLLLAGPLGWKLMILLGFSGGSVVKDSTSQCRKLGFHPWVGKITCRRKWQPTQVFLPRKSHGQRGLADYRVHGVAKESGHK